TPPIHRIFENATERIQVQRFIQGCRLERDTIAGMNGESGERQDIVNVVGENGIECRTGTTLQVIKVSPRNLGARYIRSAHETEQLPRQGRQGAGPVGISPELPGCEKEIEMRHAFERAVQPRQSEAGLE